MTLLEAIEARHSVRKHLDKEIPADIIDAFHFISFTPGTVLAEEGKGMEHIESFDYAYKLQTVRDWLFEQKK